MFQNALVSVADKTGLVEFLKPLVEKGLRIVSTGGTAQHLKKAGLSVIDVSEQTGFPEVMDGRVKTLHPKIHMALLCRDYEGADKSILAEYSIEAFDLVIGNLYPFEKALSEGLTGRELTEYIDIGGPSFLRAAAKSYERITVICDPSDYDQVLKADRQEVSLRKHLAAKVFAHTATYDSMISQNLGLDIDDPDLALGGRLHKVLRYGENPQQNAEWYRIPGATSGLHQAEVLQGKELSYNNILDIQAATATLSSFSSGFYSVAVKHNNPCGVAKGNSMSEAVRAAIQADPVSVFGGIIAVNQLIDFATAEIVSSLFLECIVAPDYSAEALDLFAKKKNLRILKWAGLSVGSTMTREKFNFRSVNGGFLRQSVDEVSKSWSDDWKILAPSAPSENIRQDILMAWKVCAHLKSNAIALVRNSQTVGLGMGQVNRVDAVDQAIARASQFHSSAKGAVLASDAFFPFADSVELAAQAGVSWIIQPGGSIKDNEVIEKAKNLGVGMVLTGRRHFLH